MANYCGRDTPSRKTETLVPFSLTIFARKCGRLSNFVVYFLLATILALIFPLKDTFEINMKSTLFFSARATFLAMFFPLSTPFLYLRQ